MLVDRGRCPHRRHFGTFLLTPHPEREASCVDGTDRWIWLLFAYRRHSSTFLPVSCVSCFPLVVFVSRHSISIKGSSSDYGVNKAMNETTLDMLQQNGVAFAMQEKENKVGAVRCAVLRCAVLYSCPARGEGVCFTTRGHNFWHVRGLVRPNTC